MRRRLCTASRLVAARFRPTPARPRPRMSLWAEAGDPGRGRNRRDRTGGPALPTPPNAQDPARGVWEHLCFLRFGVRTSAHPRTCADCPRWRDAFFFGDLGSSVAPRCSSPGVGEKPVWLRAHHDVTSINRGCPGAWPPIRGLGYIRVSAAPDWARGLLATVHKHKHVFEQQRDAREGHPGGLSLPPRLTWCFVNLQGPTTRAREGHHAHPRANSVTRLSSGPFCLEAGSLRPLVFHFSMAGRPMPLGLSACFPKRSSLIDNGTLLSSS